jgi:hypothetical protein
VPNIDGTGIEPGPNGTTAAVWGNNTDGSLSRIDLTVTPPKAASVGNHGAYGDMAVVGPDGFLLCKLWRISSEGNQP